MAKKREPGAVIPVPAEIKPVVKAIMKMNAKLSRDEALAFALLSAPLDVTKSLQGKLGAQDHSTLSAELRRAITQARDVAFL